MVEKIRDAAAQKGTGKWAVIEAMDAGIPATVISESVAARSLSSLKSDRLKASQVLAGPEQTMSSVDRDALANDIKRVPDSIFLFYFLKNI